jgi:UDP-N-acetylmuramyl pentapeptide phosphotransferase/UDP-N-acetylglucosamine-1-phosphate transferase
LNGFDAPWWVGALLAAALAAGLLQLAPRLGWLDPRPGAEALARKHQRRAAAPVGGAVLWLLAVVLPFLGGAALDSWAATLALTLGLALGTADDLRRGGLPPGTKFAGQLLAALPLLWLAEPFGHGLVHLAVALVAMNAVNTFDNSDGAATGLGVVSFAAPAPWAAGVLAGLLPWNLRRREGGLHQLYLGDAGTHLLGMGVALEPLAWPALLLPLLDLGRVVRLRLRAGERPWQGDRRHLAQALERAGWTTVPRTAALAAAAWPAAAVGPAVALAGWSPWLAALLGGGATTLAFLWLVRCSRAELR